MSGSETRKSVSLKLIIHLIYDMVRTKADCSGIKVSGAKAPRKIVNLKPTDQGNGSGASSGQYSGGNPYKPQPTPEWQKEITRFFRKDESGPSSDTVPTVEGTHGEKSEPAVSSEEGCST
ncbi:PCNA-associated factor-like [Ischnura elegans]|uniref:PCNA-associated factor-like n=1 Tax=Ischnura elegans TaxID=197161 RepID=UPI001ED88B42|nr:PCNA-associated factor-like [Ischnura elegans]